MMAAALPIGSLSPWKQNSDGDMYQVYRPRSSPKPRQTSSSPRYVRTWSPEEESYLLEARRARVPYKDIAARLNKTDLACRLHYHQMVVARKNSVPEQSSIPTPPAEQYAPVMQYHHHRADSLPPTGNAVPSQLLLPAPVIRDPSRNGSGAGALDQSHRRTISQPQTPGRRGSTPSPFLGGVAKHSPAAPGARGQQANNSVDFHRIQELYKDFAPTFWSNIAAAYSADKSLSPTDVETAFFQGQGLGLTNADPVSPDSSAGTSPTTSWPSMVPPSSSGAHARLYSSSDLAHNRSGNKKCSVNSLLNN